MRLRPIRWLTLLSLPSLGPPEPSGGWVWMNPFKCLSLPNCFASKKRWKCDKGPLVSSPGYKSRWRRAASTNICLTLPGNYISALAEWEAYIIPSGICNSCACDLLGSWYLKVSVASCPEQAQMTNFSLHPTLRRAECCLAVLRSTDIFLCYFEVTQQWLKESGV